MYELEPVFVQCPYCWEHIEILVDCSVLRQDYVEDCSVCCRPIAITAHTADGEVTGVDARSEDE